MLANGREEACRHRSLGNRPPPAAPGKQFYLGLDKDMDRKGRPQPPVNPATGARAKPSHEVDGITELDGFMALLKEIDEAAAAQGVPASGATAEFAPGQYEINLKHEDDAIRAGDHAVMLRHLIGAISRKHNLLASFTAKPFVDQTGNGTHAAPLFGDGREGQQHSSTTAPKTVP